MSPVMESATAICDSDTPASLPGYNTTEHHDAALVGILLGWLGFVEPRKRKVLSKRRNLCSLLQKVEAG